MTLGMQPDRASALAAGLLPGRGAGCISGAVQSRSEGRCSACMGNAVDSLGTVRGTALRGDWEGCFDWAATL